MIAPDQRERAGRFRQLHSGEHLLLLPNAWDAASARLFEEEGFEAIGTTSAGIAFSLGFPDGERIAFPDVVSMIERITRAVRIPVTADIEAGFGKTPEAVGASIRAVLEAGAVGVNLEDGRERRELVDLSLHAEKIRAAREAASSAGGDVVINARTDVYLNAIGPLESRLDETVRRANAYRQAGADCLFVPGVADAATIERLVQAIDGPVNVLAAAETPPVGELDRLGVARLSLGSGPMRATLGLLRRIARELRESGTYDELTAGALSYAEANRLFARS